VVQHQLAEMHRTGLGQKLQQASGSCLGRLGVIAVVTYALHSALTELGIQRGGRPDFLSSYCNMNTRHCKLLAAALAGSKH